MNSASLCSLAGRYDNPIPPQFLAPIDFLCYSPLSRILTADPKNLEGQKFKVLQTICRRGVYEEASLQLRRFFSQLGEGCKVYTEASLPVGRFFS